LSTSLQAKLKAAGVGFLTWSDRALPVGVTLTEGEVVGRFVMSFATPEAQVERLIAFIGGREG
jgi:threonine aldolase